MKRESIKYIAVAGNIGSGKTTLVSILSKHMGWKPYYDEIHKNPYISDFYRDMGRWAFSLQVYFLQKRLQQIYQIMEEKVPVIQDRTIYEDAYIFCPTLYEMGYITDNDYKTYLNLFQTVIKTVRPPDLIIYLKAKEQTLLTNILKRGRIWESNISISYIKKLNDKYEEWVRSFKECRILPIPVDNRDFENEREDIEWVVREVKNYLFGLFPI